MSKQSDQLKIESRDGQADKQPAGSNFSALELLAQAGSLPGAARGQRGADTHVKSLEIPSPYGDKVAVASAEKAVPVDPKEKFSLGVSAMSRAEIMQKKPALLGTVNDVIEDANEPEKVQYKGMKEPISSEVYKADAIGQMATKYGLPRVEDMFKALGQASGEGKAESYRFELMTNGRPEQLTANLRNMAELCAPGGVERLKELTGKLREEGFTKSFAIGEMSLRNMDMLLQKPEERKAFIEFENTSKKTTASALFLSQNPEYSTHGPHTPVERLSVYKTWLKTHH